MHMYIPLGPNLPGSILSKMFRSGFTVLSSGTETVELDKSFSLRLLRDASTSTPPVDPAESPFLIPVITSKQSLMKFIYVTVLTQAQVVYLICPLKAQGLTLP